MKRGDYYGFHASPYKDHWCCVVILKTGWKVKVFDALMGIELEVKRTRLRPLNDEDLDSLTQSTRHGLKTQRQLLDAAKAEI